MFENLTKEIILLSLIPVVVIALIDIVAFFIMKKKYRNYRFNYFFKISAIIAISFVLPLIAGYTVWVIKSFSEKGIIGNNIWYILLIIFLWIFLLIILINLYRKTLLNANEDEKIDKIVENNPKIKIWEVDKEEKKEEDNKDKK